MDTKLLKMAEALGIDTKGKRELEIAALIAENANQLQTSIVEKSRQEDIDNGVKQFPAVKKMFEKPFAVWLEKVAQGKKPECLTVVGYNMKTSEVIVCKEVKSATGEISYKLSPVDEKLIITSVKRLDERFAEVKANRKPKTTTTTTAKKKPTTKASNK